MNHPAMVGVSVNAPAYVKNARLIAWVAEIAALTEAADVYWCDGSKAEYDRLCQQLTDAGTFRAALLAETATEGLSLFESFRPDTARPPTAANSLLRPLPGGTPGMLNLLSLPVR